MSRPPLPPAIDLLNLSATAFAQVEARATLEALAENGDIDDWDEFAEWLQSMKPPQSQPIDIPVREDARRGRRTRRLYNERLFEMERRRGDHEYEEVD